MRIRRAALAVVTLAIAFELFHRSSLYRDGNRLFYRARRAINAAWSFVYGLGVLPPFLSSLETQGRRTGRTYAFPVVLADYNGSQYLVSILGERSGWVKNIRASASHAAIKHGRRREVLLEEVPPGDRAPIIRAYVGRVAAFAG